MPKFAKSIRLSNLTNVPNAITNETIIYGTQQGLKESTMIGESIFDIGGFVKEIVFSDALPYVLGIANTDLSVSEISVEVITPFDDIGTTITIGDNANNSRLMSASTNDPLTVGKYTDDCDFKYLTNETVKVYISGVNTQGRIIVRLYFN